MYNTTRYVLNGGKRWESLKINGSLQLVSCWRNDGILNSHCYVEINGV